MRPDRTSTIFLIFAMILQVAVSARAQTTMDAGKAEKTRYDGTVAIFYCTHFEDTAAHDWDPIREWDADRSRSAAERIRLSPAS